MHLMIPVGNKTRTFTVQYVKDEEAEHVLEFLKQLPRLAGFSFFARSISLRNTFQLKKKTTLKLKGSRRKSGH